MKAGQRCICDEAMDKRDGSMCEPCDPHNCVSSTPGGDAVAIADRKQCLLEHLLRTDDHGNQDP